MGKGKRSQKPINQPFFVHFANCKFEKNGLKNCFNRIPEYFSVGNNKKTINSLVHLLNSMLDQKMFQKCFIPISDYHSAFQTNCKPHPAKKTKLENVSDKNCANQWDYTLDTDKYYDDFHKRRRKVDDEFAEHYPKYLEGISEFISEIISIEMEKVDHVTIEEFNCMEGLLDAHSALRDILLKVSSGKKLNDRLLNYISARLSSKLTRPSFSLCKNAYLKRIEPITLDTKAIDSRNAIGLLIELIYQECTDYLCDSQSKPLKKCIECKKFFVQKRVREDQKCCTFNGQKCKNAYNRKKKKEKGKSVKNIKVNV